MTQNQELRDSLARKPGQVLEVLADEYHTSLETVIQSLPAEMWRKTEGTRILDILQAIATWEQPVTTIIHTPDIIAEISGRLPGGRVARGYYNFDKNPDGSGIHGHLRHENCAAIYRVERPFMGTATAALYFINHDGGCICKIFAGRDEQRELRPEQVQAMRALIP